MKKILSCLLAVALVTMSLTACGKPTTAAGEASSNNNDKKISIVATTFPQYDWLRQLLGDKTENVDLTLLLDNGVDLHSYSPTVEHIAKIADCDLFVYVGGESDGWVTDALKSVNNQDMVAVNLLDVLGDRVKQEEIVEGMEHDHDHDHEHDEISLEDIKDRPLSDWSGDWSTIEKPLASGDLDKYVTHKAEENGTDFDTQKSAYAKRWKSDYASISITETTINFGDAPANYQYIGYKLVESDHGASVWYGFELESTDSSTPHYIAFSDHGTGGEEEHEDEHDEHEDHDTPHFHLRYGNESFEALTAIEDWAPTYFPTDASGAEIAEVMGGHSHAHEEEEEMDEHVWLSLKNAQVICSYLAKELGDLDEKNAAVYSANADVYNAKLDELDAQYQAVADAAPNKTLLFGDRFPFRYLADDYGLTYFAAFSGCSAEIEASIPTVAFLAEKVNELSLKHIMVIESSDQSIAKTIIQTTTDKHQDVLVLDSMQSVTAGDAAAGTTYLSLMESNLQVLKTALS